MQERSRSSSPDSPPLAEAAEDSDFYALPNDSQTSMAPDPDEAEEKAALEIDFDLTPVHRLPNEILMYIFGRFDLAGDLFRCMLVCKRWARHAVDLLWHRPACTNIDILGAICQVLNKDRPFFSYRHFVRRLNLSNLASRINDGSIMSLAVCARIERLTLVNCLGITDIGLVSMVENTKGLLALDASNARGISDASIDALATNCRRLQGLNITNCKGVSNESLIHLARSCKYMKRLKLNGCYQVTNETVIAFANNCPNLVEIDLYGCVAISRSAVTALLTHGQALRELRLFMCDLVDDNAFLDVPDGKILGNLRILDLSNCSLITDAAVQKIITAAPRLRNLLLTKCRNLTDASAYAISQLGKNLHYLHLGHCGHITDDGLRKLVQECSRIRYIDLACCSHLTDDSITQLASLPKLKRIGLVKCLKVTDACVRALARRKTHNNYSAVSSLERVHLSYCTQLNLESIYILLNSCPKLSHLSLTGIQPFQHEKFLQFCRIPPHEFMPHQRDMFCVFSGPGVTRFRDLLNTDPDFDFLKDALIQHQRSQVPAWPANVPYDIDHLHRYTNRPMMAHSDRGVMLPMMPYHGGLAYINAISDPSFVAAGHFAAPGTHAGPHSSAIANLTHGRPGLSLFPTAFNQVGHGTQQLASTGAATTSSWLEEWNARTPTPPTRSTLAHRTAQEAQLAAMENMSPPIAFRRPRASTATGVVRWVDHGFGSGEASSPAEGPAHASETIAPPEDGEEERDHEIMFGHGDGLRGGHGARL